MNNTALALHTIEHEPRVLDTDLAERLGFSLPVDVRKLIHRKGQELARYGVVATVAITSGVRGGRPGNAFYLNEEQALLICMFSDTDNAANVRKQVIETFMAVRRGQQSVSSMDVSGLVSQLTQLVQALTPLVTAVSSGTQQAAAPVPSNDRHASDGLENCRRSADRIRLA